MYFLGRFNNTNNKDDRILGSTLGPPLFRETTMCGVELRENRVAKEVDAARAF